MKRRSKSVKDGNIFQRFLDAEFAFPIPTKMKRSKIILIKLILNEHLMKTKDEITNLGCFYDLAFARWRKRSILQLKKIDRNIHNQIANVNMDMVQRLNFVTDP